MRKKKEVEDEGGGGLSEGLLPEEGSSKQSLKVSCYQSHIPITHVS